jgi:hypothetical protein
MSNIPLPRDLREEPQGNYLASWQRLHQVQAARPIKMPDMSRSKKSIFTALLITAAMPAAASAAKFTTVADACGDGCTIISIIGDIEFYDNITFDYLIAKQKIDKAIVHLDSPGGSVSAMLDIGAEIRNAGFWTHVPPRATCTSACADIWLAGKKRVLASDALLGFHSTGQTLRGMTKPSARGDAIVQHYYRMLGLRDDAIDYFFTASTFDISYVTMPKLNNSASIAI